MSRARAKRKSRLLAVMRRQSELWGRLCFAVRDNTASFTERLQALEVASQCELESMGLPTRGLWAVSYNEGLWCECDADEPLPLGWERVFHYPPTDEIPIDDFRRESVYLYFLLNDIAQVRDALRNGDAEMTAARAFQLALHMTTMGYPARDIDQRRGARNSSDLNGASAKYNRTRREERQPLWNKWQEQANPIWAKHPSWSASQVADCVVKQLGGDLKPGTVRKRIKKVGTSQ